MLTLNTSIISQSIPGLELPRLFHSEHIDKSAAMTCDKKAHRAFLKCVFGFESGRNMSNLLKGHIRADPGTLMADSHKKFSFMLCGITQLSHSALYISDIGSL